MQDKKMKAEIVLLAVPAEMLLETGIFEGDPMQMYVDGKRLVIENLDDPGEIVCTSDCDSCPLEDMDCDGECNDCPCREICNESEAD